MFDGCSAVIFLWQIAKHYIQFKKNNKFPILQNFSTEIDQIAKYDVSRPLTLAEIWRDKSWSQQFIKMAECACHITSYTFFAKTIISSKHDMWIYHIKFSLVWL